MSDIDQRKQQIEKLQDLVSKGEEIDVAGQFDDLVDYLRDHGYDIVKRKYPKTTEERTREHISELESVEGARTPTEIEKSLKKASERLDTEPEKVWEEHVIQAVARCRTYKRDADFMELINYIKAGHSLINQLNDHE